MEYLGIVVLMVVVITLLTVLFRANELFCVSFRRGKALVVRGNLPGPALAAFRDVLNHPVADNALVKGFATDEVRLTVAGVGDEQTQRLRNAFEPFSRDQSVRTHDTRRTWWQHVGFVWLAWWMEGRDDDPPDPPRSNIVPFRR